MFQAPISTPTASKMKIGLAMEESAVCEDLTMDSQGCPFLRMTKEATMTLRINATCIGPSTAEDPNRETDPAISTMRVISGTIASIYDGSLVLFDVIDRSAISFVFRHS